LAPATDRTGASRYGPRSVSSTLLALQHIACEPPAAFEDELRSRGLELERVEVDEGEPMPERPEYAGIIVMGGPMGAYEEEAHPWLVAEKRLIRDAAEADVPVWGVCLGAQLLAASLGAEVTKGREPEVGMLPLELTEAASRDPVFSAVPRRFPALQWHSDTFELPEGATLLASSPAYRNQAFVRGRSYGLQFHLEVPESLAKRWADMPAYAGALEEIIGPGAMSRLLADLGAHVQTTLPLARRLFGRWLELVVGLERTCKVA